MDASASSGAAASAAAGSIYSGSRFVWYFIGVLLVIFGIFTSTLFVATAVPNPDNRTPVFVGGLVMVGVGILLTISNYFKFLPNFPAFQTLTGYETVRPYITVLIVLLATIGIFTALFNNYSTSEETMSFSTGALLSLSVLFVFFVLYNFSSRIEIVNVISRFLMILYYFAPYAFFMFGILTDIFTRQLQFTPAGFAGLTSVLFNFTISRLYYPDYKTSTPFCEIPGLAFLSSKLVPQSMMFVLSVVAYIATYISRSSITITPTLGSSISFATDASHRWPAWVMYFVIWAIQAALLTSNKCLDDDSGVFDTYKAVRSLLIPLGYGGILGLIGSLTLGKPQPTADGSPPPPGPVLGATGPTTTPPSVGTCTAGSSDGEFICESFENGKLKRRVMTE